jgi:hypothetical protein
MDASPLDSVFASLGSMMAASLSPVIAPASSGALLGTAPPSPPSTVGSRDLNQGTGGVRFQGFDGEALVSLAIVDLKEGNKTCLGAIGSTKRSGRFCIRVDCTIAAHRAKEKTLEDWRSNGIVEMLCVRVPSSKTVDAASIDPALPLAQMDHADYRDYLTESRSLNNWVMIFAQLRGIIRDRVDDPDDSQPIASLSQRLERASAALPTPAKRRREMEDLDENSPLSVSLAELPLDKALVTNEADRVLFKNQNQLKGALDDVNDALKSLIGTAVLMEGFKQQASDKLNALEGGIGKRPPHYSSPTVWQALQDLGEDIVSARVTITNDLSSQSHLKLEDIGEQMNKNMLYILESKIDALQVPRDVATQQQLSESITKLESRVAIFLKQTLEGGLLPSIQSITRDELPKIKTRLDILERSGTNTIDEAAALLSGFSFGAKPSSLPTKSPAQTDDAAYTELNEKYEVLLARVSDLESRSEERAVQVGGKWFTSKAQVQSWIQLECGEDNSAVGLLFLDAVSEMQLMHLDFGSIGQRMDQEHKGNRLELDDPTLQTVLFSYSVEVPECMGDTTMIASQNPNVLSKLKTYADFAGNGDFDDGLINLWNSKLDEMDISFVSTVERSGVSATIEQLAVHLHRASRAFLRALFAFITKQYEAYGASTGLKPAIRWGLVQKLVRIVWSDIAKVRRRASSITLRNAKSSSPEYMWSCFQAHRVMADYMEKGFSHHPSIAPILTGYLLKIVAFKEDLSKSSEVLQKMQANFDKSIKTIQDAMAKVATDAKVAREKATQALSKSPGAKKKAKKNDEDDE